MIFDKTIFHPQGGGQPNDEGYLEIAGQRYPVKKLVAPRNPHEEPYIIKHYYDREGDFLKGELEKIVRQIWQNYIIKRINDDWAKDKMIRLRVIIYPSNLYSRQ